MHQTNVGNLGVQKKRVRGVSLHSKLQVGRCNE